MAAWGNCDNCDQYRLLVTGMCSSGESSQCATCMRQDEIERLDAEGAIPERLASHLMVADTLPEVLTTFGVPKETIENIRHRMRQLVAEVSNQEALLESVREDMKAIGTSLDAAERLLRA